MAAGKKKKKTQANPARGFATVSQPSKAKASEPDVEPDDVAVLATNGDVANKSEISSSRTQAKKQQHEEVATDIQDLSPDELERYLENQELEQLVDMHGERCRADARRQVARLLTERRQLRSQFKSPSEQTALSDDTISTIADLQILSSDGTAMGIAGKSLSQKHIQRDALLIKLWSLRQVLLDLGLSDIDGACNYIIQKALHGDLSDSKDYMYGLAEALQWYGVSASRNDIELPDYSASGVLAASVEEGSNGDEHFGSVKVKAEQKEEQREVVPLDDNAALTDPSSDTESDLEDVEDPTQLVNVYIKAKSTLLKVELAEQQPQTGRLKQRRKRRALNKLATLERDILFDKDAAETAWLPVSYQLRASHTQAIREAKMNSGASTPATQENRNPAPNDQDENEDSGVDILGDMFTESDIADSATNTAKQDSGDVSNVTLLEDFGKWHGQHPRKVLEEMCKTVDSESKLQFTTLPAITFGCRHRIRLQWSSPQTLIGFEVEALPDGIKAQIRLRSWTLNMEHVAARDRQQSEAYITVLMLFVVMAGSSRATSCAARLPNVWRELFGQLLVERKQLIATNDTETLRHIRGQLMEVEKQASQMRCDELPTIESTALPSRPKQTALRPIKSTFDATRAKQEWDMRSSRPIYHEYLMTRTQLPVYQYKAEILETIRENSVTIICADTGSGKSTQIPGYVLEKKLTSGQDCHILVTQPRRISAISLARRVSQEIGEAKADLGTERSLIGYAIRLESKMSSSTRITYATTGVLLRMLEGSFNLEHLDVLVLDEVHERTLDLDLLFIALRRLMRRRSTLKIILMSATIDAKSFSAYFDQAPILNLPGRTFPVDVRYLEDAVENTLDVKIDGTRNDSPMSTAEEDEEGNENAVGYRRSLQSDLVPDEYRAKTKSIITKMNMHRIDYELVIKLCVAIATKKKYANYSKAILIFMPGIGEIRRLSNALSGHPVFATGWVVHQLHSTFSTEELERAFVVPPPGQRKIVIATNIAETGITIPDVTCVIDTCKEKVMRFNERRQLSRLTEGFIARSSARQRRGRAARVQEGLCFHLVTKHRFDNMMPEQHEPEIQRLSLQDPILRVKLWRLGSIEETLSEAIEPPNAKNITRAIQRLKEAGALSTIEELTQLGRKAARLPLEMPLAKLAILGTIFKCLDATISIIAIMSSKSPFVTTSHDSKLSFKKGDSDLITTYYAYQCWKKARLAGSAGEFCRKNHVSDQTFSQIEDQKVQLVVYLVDAGMLSLTSDERTHLNRARTASWRRDFYQLPSRYDIHTSDTIVNSIIAMAFYPRILTREGKGWRNIYTNQTVTLTPKSVNHFSRSTSSSTRLTPRYLSFYEIMQAKSGHLNAFETSAVPESLIPLSLGMQVDFKLFSGLVNVDNGKIRVAFREWKAVAAMKVLREHVEAVMERWYRDGEEGETEVGRKWIELWARVVVGEAGAG